MPGDERRALPAAASLSSNFLSSHHRLRIGTRCDREVTRPRITRTRSGNGTRSSSSSSSNVIVSSRASGSATSGSSTAGVPASFPPFLPQRDVQELNDQAARTLAARITRVPVQTSLSPLPIATSCIAPSSSSSPSRDISPLSDTMQHSLPTTPIVLLHSFDSCLLEWRHTLPLLESKLQSPAAPAAAQLASDVWAVDTLGWGYNDMKGDANISSFSAEAKTEHLFEFWRQVVGGRPAVFVGPSLGGAAAVDLAVKHPEAVAGLVLVDAQVVEAEGVPRLPDFLARMGISVLKSMPLRAMANRMSFVDEALRQAEDPVRVGRLHCLMPGWEDAMLDFMRSGGYSVAQSLHRVTQPTTVLWGANDKVLNIKFAQEIKEILPQSTLNVLLNCGHTPHIERPAEVAAAIIDFVAKIRPDEA